MTGISLNIEEVVEAYKAANALLGVIGRDGQVDIHAPQVRALQDALEALDDGVCTPDRLEVFLSNTEHRMRYAVTVVEAMGNEIVKYTRGNKADAQRKLDKHLAFLKGEAY